MGVKHRTITLKGPPDTLLLLFMDKKAAEYDAPERKGTPKGETIGLSPFKYGAVLWFLQGAKVKEVAENIGVSYGVLRKWRTEELFKKQLDTFEKEFVKIWCKHIQTKWRSADLGKTGRPVSVWAAKEITEIRQYSKSLLIAIQREIGLRYQPSKKDFDKNSGLAMDKLNCCLSMYLILDPHSKGGKVLQGYLDSLKPKMPQILERELKKFIKMKNPNKIQKETALAQVEAFVALCK
jgi:hypothetical protein